MKAFTVRQPYADAIVWEAKPVENRTKPLPGKYVGVPVALHAAKEPHVSGITAADLADITGASISEWLDTRSAILAVIRFGGCHQAAGGRGCCRPWGQVPTATHPKVWHWEIAAVIRLSDPVPAKGALGFWTPDEETVNAVLRQETGVAW